MGFYCRGPEDQRPDIVFLHEMWTSAWRSFGWISGCMVLVMCQRCSQPEGREGASRGGRNLQGKPRGGRVCKKLNKHQLGVPCRPWKCSSKAVWHWEDQFDARKTRLQNRSPRIAWEALEVSDNLAPAPWEHFLLAQCPSLLKPLVMLAPYLLLPWKSPFLLLSFKHPQVHCPFPPPSVTILDICLPVPPSSLCQYL